LSFQIERVIGRLNKEKFLSLSVCAKALVLVFNFLSVLFELTYITCAKLIVLSGFEVPKHFFKEF